MRDRKFKVVCETESLISLLLLLLLLLPLCLCCSQTLIWRSDLQLHTPPSSFSPLWPRGADPLPAAAPRTLLHPGTDLRRPLSKSDRVGWLRTAFLSSAAVFPCNKTPLCALCRRIDDGDEGQMTSGSVQCAVCFLLSWARNFFFFFFFLFCSLSAFPKAQCYFQSAHSGKRSKQDFTTILDCILELSSLQPAPVWRFGSIRASAPEPPHDSTEPLWSSPPNLVEVDGADLHSADWLSGRAAGLVGFSISDC